MNFIAMVCDRAALVVFNVLLVWPAVHMLYQETTDITGIEAPYAYLAINIAQEPDSWETVTEINPLEIAEVFGNIGGFWGEANENYTGRRLIMRSRSKNSREPSLTNAQVSNVMVYR